MPTSIKFSYIRRPQLLTGSIQPFYHAEFSTVLSTRNAQKCPLTLHLLVIDSSPVCAPTKSRSLNEGALVRKGRLSMSLARPVHLLMIVAAFIFVGAIVVGAI